MCKFCTYIGLTANLHLLVENGCRPSSSYLETVFVHAFVCAFVCACTCVLSVCSSRNALHSTSNIMVQISNWLHVSHHLAPEVTDKTHSLTSHCSGKSTTNAYKRWGGTYNPCILDMWYIRDTWYIRDMGNRMNPVPYLFLFLVVSAVPYGDMRKRINSSSHFRGNSSPLNQFAPANGSHFVISSAFKIDVIHLAL